MALRSLGPPAHSLHDAWGFRFTLGRRYDLRDATLVEQTRHRDARPVEAVAAQRQDVGSPVQSDNAGDGGVAVGAER